MKDSQGWHINLKEWTDILRNKRKQELKDSFKNNQKVKWEIENESTFERARKHNSDEIYNRKHQEIIIDWEKDYYELRRQWSESVKKMLYVMVWFQYFILLWVSLWIVANLFSFEQAKPLLLVIAWENFVQILWLAYIVVKFLYPDTKKN